MNSSISVGRSLIFQIVKEVSSGVFAFKNIGERSTVKNYRLVKGYLCYKMLTSQNVSSEAQIKNFFIS